MPHKVVWQNKYGATFETKAFDTYLEAEQYADAKAQSGRCIGLHIDPPMPVTVKSDTILQKVVSFTQRIKNLALSAVVPSRKPPK